MDHTLTLVTALLGVFVPACAADLLLASRDAPPVPIIAQAGEPRTREAAETLAVHRVVLNGSGSVFR